MNYELTITLKGNEALAYIKKVHTELMPKVDETMEKSYAAIKKLAQENNNLKEELKQLKNDLKVKELDAKYNTTITYKDTSEDNIATSGVIKSNPVHFPASKSGTNWSADELAAIEQAFENNHTLQSLKLLLHGRSEAAIRSMLNKYGINVKRNKLYKRT